MSRPIVVIPACTTLIEGYVFDAVGRKYATVIAEVADCQPLLVPVGPGISDIASILDVADAILLTGSLSNVAPEHYGDEPSAHPGCCRAQNSVIRDLPRLPGAERGPWRQPSSGGSRRERTQGPPPPGG